MHLFTTFYCTCPLIPLSPYPIDTHSESTIVRENSYRGSVSTRPFVDGDVSRKDCLWSNKMEESTLKKEKIKIYLRIMDLLFS